MTTPPVSVILPCYNAHRFLGQTIESIRAQTIRDLEILVVNDGSTDPETLTFLASLPADVRVVHQENRGLSGARNRGFREASADLVLPLDCDDWLEPDFVEKLLRALQENDANRTFVFSHLALEGDVEGVLVKNFNFFEQLFANQLPYCMLISKDLWRAAGGYDETMRLGYEDWDFNISLACTGAAGVAVAEPLFHYRVSTTGMLQTTSHKQHGVLWGAIQNKHADLYQVPSLWKLWRKWRHEPSTRPLWIYLLYLGSHHLLPERLFLWLFRKAMFFSQLRRLRRRAGMAQSG